MPPWINPSNPLEGAQNAVDSTIGAGQDAVDSTVGAGQDAVRGGSDFVFGGTQDFVGDAIDGPANFVNTVRDETFDQIENVVEEGGETARFPFVALAAVGIAIAVAFGFGGDS